MNEYYQKKITTLIDTELIIDRKIRVELCPILQSLTKDKKHNLNLSIETTQNEHLKKVLYKIREELCKTQIIDFDEKNSNIFTQNRIDEILELNVTKLSEKEQKEINNNLNNLDDFSKNIDRNKY